MKVLLVEDERTTRTLVRSLLRARGFEVTETASAEEGWEAYQRSPTPIVVLNWMLPGHTGLELCRQIRAHRRGMESVVLVVTGRTDPGALAQVLDAGADDYIAKPVDPALLGIRLAIAKNRVDEVRERLRAERDRRRFESKMQHAQKLESLGVLAGGIAHDFNNMLVGILGHANLALMDIHPESPLRRDIEKIEQAAARASDLTNQMLAYAGKTRFQVERVDLNELLREMADLLDISRSKSVGLVFGFEDEELEVNADPTQLRQVFMNLITNASDAVGDSPGTITLRTGTVELGSEELVDSVLGIVPAGRYQFVEVEDNGAGMAEDTMGRIFDPFFTTKTSGRGLGLAAVVGIVRGHRGTITVQSTLGIGTTIRVLLPPAEAGPPRAAPTSHLAGIGKWSGSGTVLVADDEEGVRAVTRTLLERLGFTVLLARSGEEALEQFTTHQADIVTAILDMTMPGLSVERVIKELRRRVTGLPIIVCSGHLETEANQRFGSLGFSGFLHKPFRPGTLVDLLKRAIGPGDQRGGAQMESAMSA